MLFFHLLSFILSFQFNLLITLLVTCVSNYSRVSLLHYRHCPEKVFSKLGTEKKKEKKLNFSNTLCTHYLTKLEQNFDLFKELFVNQIKIKETEKIRRKIISN